MWCFSWIFRLGLACSFAVFNALRLELRNDMLVLAPAFTPKMKNMPTTPKMKNMSVVPAMELKQQAALSAGRGQKV
ncbi:cytochrome bd-I oxidase subunit CydX [Pseudochrobactrum sp. sp1633]|uniref:cytochrome bd-I oxidase subunit CydX n=1 Tax=Pseudochrobactrum sp. sp1633 TaxID=3036706 RepID=UPI0027E44C11|nr:cytochrome bd-I oxidase subunit CydX [Pseudochrobactrum sp. sp1633]HWD13809.1 cytochrome bd-I oxidase subunit CydX [Pseudochrobactrum sp.]